MTLADLTRRQLERRRLAHLALACVAVLALVVLVACGDLSDAEIESSVAVSGETTTTSQPKVRIAAVDGPQVFDIPTTTSPPTTAAPAPRVPPPSAPVTTAPPTPTTVRDVTASGSGGVHPAIAAAFGTGDLGHQAHRVAVCESNLNPRAYNPSGASGLFQVMPLWAEDYQRVTGQPYYDGRFDAYANAAFARWLWGQTQSWKHWTCKP